MRGRPSILVINDEREVEAEVLLRAWWRVPLLRSVGVVLQVVGEGRVRRKGDMMAWSWSEEGLPTSHVHCVVTPLERPALT